MSKFILLFLFLLPASVFAEAVIVAPDNQDCPYLDVSGSAFNNKGVLNTASGTVSAPVSQPKVNK